MTKWTPPYSEDYGDQMHRLFGISSDKMLTVTLQVTEDCNLRCSYCYQHNKSKKRMSLDTAKRIVDQVLSDYYHTANKKAIVLEFIGGEPFLEIDLIAAVSDYFVSECVRLHHRFLNRFRFSFSTNGMLHFDPRVQAYLEKYHNVISLGVSIDGNRELHDTCRLDAAGQGTYDRALAAEMDYTSRYGVLKTTKFTIAPANVKHVYQAVRNLISLGYSIIHLNCVFEEGWTKEHAGLLYRELKRLADYLLETDSFNRYYISMFDEGRFSPMDPSDDQNWCGGVGEHMMAFDPDGRLFPCIRYMESSVGGKQEPYAIGDLNGYTEVGLERLKVLNSVTRSSQSTEECFNCPVAKGCAWCSAYNYECTGTPNKRVTYICWMHKATALANYYYYNRGHSLLGEHERMEIHLPERDALEIISKEEWDMLTAL